jgi:phosphoribosylanthranilate isomerase
MVDVKICGLTDVAGLDAALAGGARYVGFVSFPKSPRHLTPEAARALAQRVRDRADTVLVTVNADDALLSVMAEAVAPDFIQLHGEESPARAAAVRRFARRGVIKAIPVAVRSDLEAAHAFKDVAELFLFDAKAPPGAALPGGNGLAFDWSLLRGARPPKPWMLSGGLTPANVAEALAESAAAAVDVSSGVERAPGVKDPAMIVAFLRACGSAPARALPIEPH